MAHILFFMYVLRCIVFECPFYIPEIVISIVLLTLPRDVSFLGCEFNAHGILVRPKKMQTFVSCTWLPCPKRVETKYVEAFLTVSICCRSFLNLVLRLWKLQISRQFCICRKAINRNATEKNLVVGKSCSHFFLLTWHSKRGKMEWFSARKTFAIFVVCWFCRFLMTDGICTI